jgi:hypothetical protein
MTTYCGRESGVFDRERWWLFLLFISCNIAEANLMVFTGLQEVVVD